MRHIVNEDKYTVKYVGGVPQEDNDHPDALNNYAVISYQGVERMTWLPSSIKSCGTVLVELVDQILASAGGLSVSKENLSLLVDILIAEREEQGRTFYAGKHVKSYNES
jgi:hypothetical protein